MGSIFRLFQLLFIIAAVAIGWPLLIITLLANGLWPVAIIVVIASIVVFIRAWIKATKGSTDEFLVTTKKRSDARQRQEKGFSPHAGDEDNLWAGRRDEYRQWKGQDKR